MFKLIPKRTFTGIIMSNINNKEILQTKSVSFLSNKYKYIIRHNNISSILEVIDSIDDNRNFPIDNIRSILLMEYEYNKNKYYINETIEMADDSYNNGKINCMYSLVINNNIRNRIFIDDYKPPIDLLGRSIILHDIINNKFNKEFN
jgi:hypothetical protein